MSPTFTPDDVGKTVESADGEALGVVAAVDQTTAYIEPDPGVTDSIKAVLDWQADSDPAVPLADDAVREVTGDAVRLESEFPEESITTGDTGGDDRPDDRPEGSGRKEMEIGSARGEPVADDVTETETDVTGRDTGPGTGGPGESEPTVDDEFYDAPEGGARVDPDDEMDELESEERADTDGAASDGTEANETTDAVEELDSVEAEASRELDVDPTELTEREPEAEIEPREDVGQRTDVGTDVDDVSEEDLNPAPDGPTTEDARPGGTESEVESETDRRSDVDEAEAEDRDEDPTIGGERDGEADR